MYTGLPLSEQLFTCIGALHQVSSSMVHGVEYLYEPRGSGAVLIPDLSPQNLVLEGRAIEAVPVRRTVS